MDKEILIKLDEIENLTLLAAKKVLTIQDCALLTGMSISYIYKLTCLKKIPHYKPNNKLLYFDRSEIENWMLQGRVLTNDEIEGKAQAYIINGQVPSQN